MLKNKSELRSSSNPEEIQNVFTTLLEKNVNKALREQLLDKNKAEKIYVMHNRR